MSVEHWISAARLRTLPLAIANMAMGNGLAAMAGVFNWSVCILSITTAAALQVLSNFANDYGDTLNGADSSEREGPARAVQSGSISLIQMKTAIWITAAIAFVLGLMLLLAAFEDITTILIFIGIGLMSIWAAYNYTAGSNPYGYAGLGDISVFIFFGLVAVIGCYYLQVKTIDWSILLPASACGLLSVGVLNVNNIRDINSDKKAGKRSIPVIIGKSNAITYHALLLVLSWACLVAYTSTHGIGAYRWLFLIALPLFIMHWIKVNRAPDAMTMDPYLKQLALSTALTVTLFLAGHLCF